MFLNIEDKKTGEKVCLNIKSFHTDEFFSLYEYINNISDFKFYIINEDNN